MKISISDMNITSALPRKKGPQEDGINSTFQFRLARGFNLLTIACIWHEMKNVNQGNKALNQVRAEFTLNHGDILSPAAAD